MKAHHSKQNEVGDVSLEGNLWCICRRCKLCYFVAVVGTHRLTDCARCRGVILGRADECTGNNESRLRSTTDQTSRRDQERTDGQEGEEKEQVRGGVRAILTCPNSAVDYHFVIMH